MRILTVNDDHRGPRHQVVHALGCAGVGAGVPHVDVPDGEDTGGLGGLGQRVAAVLGADRLIDLQTNTHKLRLRRDEKPPQLLM